MSTTYYISSSLGADSNDGRSEAAPWSSFANANATLFQPGDRILLKCGDIWAGTTFYPQGNGSLGNPIVISSYGTGDKPVLTGSESSNVYGIKIVDFGGYSISGIEFGPVPCGISWWADQADNLEDLRIEACYFHDAEIANPAFFDAAAGYMKVPYPDLYTGTGITLGGIDTVGGTRLLSRITIADCTFYRTESGVFTSLTSNRSDLAHQYPERLTSNQIGELQIEGCSFVQNYGGRSVRYSYTSGGGGSNCLVDQTGYFKGEAGGVAGVEFIHCSGLTLSGWEIKHTLVFGSSMNGSGVDFSRGNSDITLSGCTLADNVGAAFDIYESNTNIVIDGCTLRNNNVSSYTGNKAYWTGAGNTGGTVSNCRIYLQNDAQQYQGTVVSPLTFASSNCVWDARGTLVFGSSGSSGPTPSRLRAAVFKYDLTPTVPTAVSWGDAYIATPPEDILDSIYVRILALEDSINGKKLIFIAPDMCLYDELARDPMRIFPTGTLQRFADAAGVTVDYVFVVPTHTHQGPQTVMDETILQGIADGIETAVSNLTAVHMGYIEDRNDLGVNRRPDYGVSPNLAYDNRFVGFKFTRVSDGVPVACALHYPVHNTAYGNSWVEHWNKITTEITGFAMNDIEDHYSGINANFVSIFLNGFYGDAGPDVYGSKNGDYATITARGHQFGSELLPFMDNIVPVPLTGAIDVFRTSETVDAVPEDTYENYDIVCSGARIGDEIGFIGVSCEPFTEIAAHIKARSPFKITIASANTNGDSGYVPTYDAFHDGIAGHETLWPKCPFYEDIEQVVVKNSLHVLQTLYGKGGDGLLLYAASGSASSTNKYAPAAQAFDRSGRTKWLSTGEARPWLQADLGTVRSISRIVMNFGNFDRRECGKNYEIRVSHDADFHTSTTVARDRGNSSCQIAYSFSPVAARYVRFYSHAGFGSDARLTPAVYGMEVWGSGAFEEPASTALLTDDFTEGLRKWLHTSNAEVTGRRLHVFNNPQMRSAAGATWTDYSYEVDAENAANGYLGLMFRAKDDHNCYMWQFSYGALGFMKKVAGSWQQVKPYINLPMSLVREVRHHYKIEVVGHVINTYINNVLVDTTTDPTIDSGGVGFWTGTTDTAIFDNVIVRSL